MIKKIYKKEVIIAFIIGLIIASSITVYAYSHYAKDIVYTKPGETQAISVETALNELYSNKDEYKNKTYTQTGLSVYNNRVTITDGGYYTDDKVVFNLTFKLNTTLSKNNVWLLINGLPNVDNKFIVTDTNKQRVFYVGNANGYNNSINFFDHGGSDLSANTSITLQFKY